MSTAVDGTRRRNGAATARRLLEAARVRFGRLGYERTGLRDIAADVGVDQALVIRYFGSKEKLFAMACPPEPKTYGLFTGPKEELPERLVDWLMAIEAGEGGGQFVTLLQSGGGEAATNLLRERLDHFTSQVAGAIDSADADLRADLIAAWILGIAAMSRIARRPSLENRSARELSPYVVPALAGLMRAKKTVPEQPKP